MTQSADNLFPASKITDQSGNLMPLYHGSKHSFSQFCLDHFADDLHYGGGIYFTANRNLAATYAGNKFGQDSEGYIYEVYLNIQNPYRTMLPLIYKPEFENMSSAEIRNELIRQGYDGVVEIFWNGELYDESVVVAFYPEQIKILNPRVQDKEVCGDKPRLDSIIESAKAQLSHPKSEQTNPEFIL